ncbi:MAG TPA: DUF805 domain-containing protein, partial [Streptomyces sp.]
HRVQWYLGVFKKYAVFSGRAGRKEFRMYYLFTFLALLTLSLIGAAAHTMILFFTYVAAIIVPTLSLTVRRLHDTGMSGRLVLIALIPLIGSLILYGYMCADGETGQNKYGPDPRQTNLPPYKPHPQP